MASLTYFFLFLCMISQVTNIAHCISGLTTGDGVRAADLSASGSISNSTNYQNNLNSVLSVFVNESNSRGFFNASSGAGSDVAYGWYLCRGDVSTEKCNDCLKMVQQFFLTSPLNKYAYFTDGIVYNMPMECVVRYSNNQTLFTYRQPNYLVGEEYGDDLDEYPVYNTTLQNSMQELAREVGNGGNSTRPNFATRVVDVAGTQEKIDVVVQCTPDISAMNCENCIRDLSTHVDSKVNGYAIGNNCLLRYDSGNLTGSGYPSYVPNYLHLILVFMGTMYLLFM